MIAEEGRRVTNSNLGRLGSIPRVILRRSGEYGTYFCKSEKTA
jgi:hypothetical protein